MPRNKIWEGSACFTTHVVTNHTPVFTSPSYSDTICRSLEHCRNQHNLKIYGYVIMPDHLHLLTDCHDPQTLQNILFRFRRYIATTIFQALELDGKHWALAKLKTAKNDALFWENSYEPKDASREDIFLQKLAYIHQNPVRTGFVQCPEYWTYSSARDYYLGEKGPVTIDFFDEAGYEARRSVS